MTPKSNAGLFHISLGLFSPQVRVRVATVELLERMIGYEVSRHVWAKLSQFAKLAFLRAKKEILKRDNTGDNAVENGTGVPSINPFTVPRPKSFTASGYFWCPK